jgi:hypothetical protein
MRLAFALLVAAAACSQPPKKETPVGSGSPMGSAGDRSGGVAEAEAVVTDAATAEAAKGMKAAATGKAGNAKLGAVVMLTDRVPVYCTPLESWPSDVNGKAVTAHGTLEHTDEFAAEGGGAGTSGAVWVLRDCKYDPPSP